jgi:type IV pilus assembly protein PilA
MFCGRCGVSIQDGSQVCGHCGQSISGQTVPWGAATPPVTTPDPNAPTSGKALASMITGIFGLIFFLPAFAAIILGHMSRSEIRRSNGRLKGNGMATAGLVMGYGAFATIPFVLIIAAIAIPNLLRARTSANESSGVASLREINTAEISYQLSHPDIGFACSLGDLGGRGASPSARGGLFIDDALASGEKHGYRFAIENCVNTATEHKYRIIARPTAPDQTGVRILCTDESDTIRAGNGKSAQECLENGALR